MSTSFVATVRQQSWYPEVQSAMAEQKVPEYVWISAIAAENPSAVGDSAIMNRPVTDPPGFSYGMFQFHNDPNGVDPVYSGNKAANIMGPALANLGASYTPRQALSAIEKAAWPGNDPKLIAKEDPQRVAAMQSVINQETSLPLSQESGAQNDPYANDNPLQQWIYNNTFIGGAEKNIDSASNGISSAVSQGVNSINTTVSGLAQQAFIGGIILAIIAGGFALLASSNGETANG